MNYFEFKKILDADPYSQDADFLQAISDDLRCRKSYNEAMRQEKMLKAALNFTVPDQFKNEIIFKQCNEKKSSRKFNVFALAASLVSMIGLSAILWYTNKPSDLETFINNTMMKDSTVILEKEEIPVDDLKALFASLDTNITKGIGKVHFMKICTTPNGKGARMVVMNDENQPITILYMPNTNVEQQIEMNMNQFKGKVIALEKGAAAIVGRQHQQIAQIEQNLLNSIKPME